MKRCCFKRLAADAATSFRSKEAFPGENEARTENVLRFLEHDNTSVSFSLVLLQKKWRPLKMCSKIGLPREATHTA